MTAGMSSVTEAVSHLPLACGSRGFALPFGFAACAFFFRRFCAGVPDDLVLPGHVMPPLLGRSRRVQPVLEHPPQQLPAPHLQLFLQLSMLQPRRLR